MTINFNNLLKNTAFIVFSLFFVGILLLFLLSVVAKAPGPLKDEKTVFIEAGMSSLKIGKILEHEGIIANNITMLAYIKFYPVIHSVYSFMSRLSGILSQDVDVIKYQGMLVRLRAAEYTFNPHDSLHKVVKKIAEGIAVQHKIVIPEGLTVKQIVDLLNNEKKLAGKINTLPIEGTLFPASYYFYYGDSREKIINMMKNKMDKVLFDIEKNFIPSPYIKTVNDVIILASIIQKEALLDRERSRIAGVFINRLKRKMRLQACSTVIYALTDGKYNLNRGLVLSDLKFDSPFNTYNIYGLPPTAISAPGMKSIEAVLHPFAGSELYFVTRGDGSHNFSMNFANHLVHKQSFYNAK